MAARRFVYILRSDTHPDRQYVGLTGDVERRLEWHNGVGAGVTRHHRPWSLVVSLEFADATTAARFERYLKTGSGRALRRGTSARLRHNRAVTSMVDELRRKVAATLRFALDAHERGAFDEFAPLYDQIEREASTLDALDPDVAVAIHFLDCWYDSANHDWMYHDRMGAGDWPRVATRLASDLESGAPIDVEVREQFAFTLRPGLVSRLRDLFQR